MLSHTLLMKYTDPLWTQVSSRHRWLNWSQRLHSLWKWYHADDKHWQATISFVMHTHANLHLWLQMFPNNRFYCKSMLSVDRLIPKYIAKKNTTLAPRRWEVIYIYINLYLYISISKYIYIYIYIRTHCLSDDYLFHTYINSYFCKY